MQSLSKYMYLVLVLIKSRFRCELDCAIAGTTPPTSLTVSIPDMILDLLWRSKLAEITA
jgi:hypothetical protein